MSKRNITNRKNNMSIETITLNKETYDSLVNSEKELEIVKHEFKLQANKLNDVNKKLTLVESGKYVVNIRTIIENRSDINLKDHTISVLNKILSNKYCLYSRLNEDLNYILPNNITIKTEVEDCKLITDLVTERVKYLRTKLYPDLVEELEQKNAKIEELSKELMKIKNDLIDSKDEYNKAIYRENELFKKVDDIKKYLSNFPDLTEDKSILYLKHKFINFRYNSSNKITAITKNRLKAIINGMYHTINDIVFRK